MPSEEEWEDRIRKSKDRSIKIEKFGARVGVFCAGIEAGCSLGLSELRTVLLAIVLFFLCECLYKIIL